MDCLQFANWLENRDTFDTSEANKAIKHSDKCQECTEKLLFDETLDGLIQEAMQPVEIPKSLRNKVDLSLDAIPREKSKHRFGLYGAMTAAVAAVFVFVLSFVSTPVIPGMEELGKYAAKDHFYHDNSVLVTHNPLDLKAQGDINIEYDAVKKQLPTDFSFVGARICPLGDCMAVHLVYTDKAKKNISLFMIKREDVDFSLDQGKNYKVKAKGGTVKFWQKGEYIYAMIG